MTHNKRENKDTDYYNFKYTTLRVKFDRDGFKSKLSNIPKDITHWFALAIYIYLAKQDVLDSVFGSGAVAVIKAFFDSISQEETEILQNIVIDPSYWNSLPEFERQALKRMDAAKNNGGIIGDILTGSVIMGKEVRTFRY